MKISAWAISAATLSLCLLGCGEEERDAPPPPVQPPMEPATNGTAPPAMDTTPSSPGTSTTPYSPGPPSGGLPPEPTSPLSDLQPQPEFPTAPQPEGSRPDGSNLPGEPDVKEEPAEDLPK